jgi:phosphoglucomutase
MKEGEEFDVGGVIYVIKDGKPVPKESTEDVEAEKEEKAAKEEEKKVEEVEMEDATPMDETKVVDLITKTVAPMIEEAMKAVVDSVIKATDTKEEDDKSEDLKYEDETKVANGWHDFVSKRK